MRPVCVTCKKEMVCATNGVSVAPAHAPRHTYNGDMFRCKECGNEVIIGFGNPHQANKDASLLVSYD